MATSRPFAYNTGSPIAGTEQIGDLAVGWPTNGFESTGLEWWNGPNEESGYVIAKPISGDTQPTPIFGGNLTLSATYKGGDIVLSNSNQTAYQQFGYEQSVLGQTFINGDDKVMFSVSLSLADPGASPDSHFVGVGKRSMNYQGNPYVGFPGNDAYSLGFNSAGVYYYNGSVSSTGFPTFGDGDIIDVCISHGQYWWIRVNGGNWNNDPSANPSTNSGGIGMNGLIDYYPVICPGYEGTMTIQNTSSYGVPEGYTLLGSNVNASVGFSRTSSFDDNEFVQLANSITNAGYTNASEASVDLRLNGYWNSYIYPILSLDAGNVLSYPGSGTTWTDLVGGKTFSLINGPTYSSESGGRIQFSSASSQYAQTNSSLPDLSSWTVGVWHYYTGTNIGSGMCIVTEVYPGVNSQINYSIGDNYNSGNMSAGFFDGAWRTTSGYSLTSNNWYYIVGTYDGNTIKLYINNTLVQSSNYTGSSISSQGGIRLMRRWDNPDYWGGYLAKVDIYDKVLDSTKISSIWNGTKSRFGL